MGHDQHDAEALWESEAAKVKAITEKGVSTYCAGCALINEAFQLTDKCLRCMDEGTAGGLHLAGSGILMEMDEAVAFVKAAGVDGIYSHAECGAAGIYADREGLDREFADDFARNWAKSLADHAGLPYKGHLDIQHMGRPSGLHKAVAVYYDATGSFDFSRVPELPSGFIINRKYLKPDYALSELKTALNIAFGSHGFGERFTVETPFLIIILAADQATADALMVEVGELENDRVKIETYVHEQ